MSMTFILDGCPGFRKCETFEGTHHVKLVVIHRPPLARWLRVSLTQLSFARARGAVIFMLFQYY